MFLSICWYHWILWPLAPVSLSQCPPGNVNLISGRRKSNESVLQLAIAQAQRGLAPHLFLFLYSLSGINATVISPWEFQTRKPGLKKTTLNSNNTDFLSCQLHEQVLVRWERWGVKRKDLVWHALGVLIHNTVGTVTRVVSFAVLDTWWSNTAYIITGIWEGRGERYTDYSLFKGAIPKS